MVRQWQPRELRMVGEYLVAAYPGETHLTRVRLGSLEPAGDHGPLDEAELRTLGVLRRWADAIVITASRMILIEATIRAVPGKLGQLEDYAARVPLTPELAQYRDRPLELELVFAIEDLVITQRCREKGIRPVHFAPPWVLDYIKELYPREQRPTPPRGLPTSGE